MITKEKMPWCFIKFSQLILKGNVWDQFGEFVCGYWGLKGWGGCHVAVGILLLYLHFSLSLSQFQPIFVVCRHFCCPIYVAVSRSCCFSEFYPYMQSLICRLCIIYFCNKQFEIHKVVVWWRVTTQIWAFFSGYG